LNVAPGARPRGVKLSRGPLVLRPRGASLRGPLVRPRGAELPALVLLDRVLLGRALPPRALLRGAGLYDGLLVLRLSVVTSSAP
jgi:hypothetical protein